MTYSKSSSEFTVSSVLRCTWDVLWKKPMYFLGMALLLTIILSLLSNIRTILFLYNLLGPSLIAVKSIVIFLSSIVLAIFECAITYAILAIHLDFKTSALDSFKLSASQLPSVILGTAIISLIIIVFWVIAGMGISILIIPALVILFIFGPKIFVFIPACIVEKKGPIESLRRSCELIKGLYFWHVLFILLLPCVVTKILGFIVKNLGLENEFMFNIIWILIMLIPQAYLCILPVITYYKLRVAKENFTLDSLVE